MPIEFNCSDCQKLLKVPDESAGKKARCPECQSIQVVPVGFPAQTPIDPPAAGFPQSQTQSSNPYSSPTIPSQKPYSNQENYDGTIRHQVITFDRVFSMVINTYKVHFGPMALCAIIVLAIVGGTNFVLSMVQNGAQLAGMEVYLPVLVVTQIIGFLVQTGMQLGLTNFLISVVRDGRPEYEKLLQFGPFMLRGIGYSILVGLIAVVVLAVCMIPVAVIMLVLGQAGGGNGNSETFLFALFGFALFGYAVAFFVIFPYFLGLHFIVDRNAGITESMKLSAEYLKGNKLTAFLLIIVSGLISIPLICTCIGLLVVMTLAPLLMVTVYLMATGQPIHRSIASA